MTERGPWKGAALGVLGGAAGLLSMRLYWRYAAPQVNRLAGQHASWLTRHQRQEAALTAALGRVVYHALTGEDPGSATERALSLLVHWGYGLGQGGVYGALRGGAAGSPLVEGAVFGMVLWLLGNELAAPLLGLPSGRGAAPALGHLNRLGARVSYGLGCALTTRLLYKVV